MELPKGTTVCIGRHTYRDEIPDAVAKAHGLTFPSEKKPEPPKKPATMGSPSNK